ILNIIRTSDVTINEISNPRFINERLFFKVFVVTKTDKRIGVASIKKDSSDIIFHFYREIGMIDNYYIVNYPEIIGVHLKPNTLIGEKFEAEIQYFQDNNKLEFTGYRPV